MTKEEFIKLYWRQYLSLEKDIIETDDYVTLDKKNYATFSNNYAKIFIMTCSEIDSLLVQFSKMVKADYKEESDIKANNILKRLDTIKTAYPKIGNYHVKTKFPFNDLNYVPYSDFSKEHASEWWKDYNELKHNRTEQTLGGKYLYENANLKNTMQAIAAYFLLCYLVNNYYDDKGKDITEEARLFEFVG